jgi:hypothetical protein
MLHPFLGPPALLLLVTAIALGGVPLQLAIGRSLVTPSHGEATSRVERWALRFALGAVSWMALLFVLASLRLLRPAVLVPLLLVLALSGLLLVSAGRRRDRAHRDAEPALENRHAAGAAPAGASRRGVEILALLVVGGTLIATLAALWLHALRPDVATDADVYHLTLPRLYLEHGGFYRVPWSVYSNWPLGLELLFGAAMAAADHVLASQLHFAFGVLAMGLAGVLAASDLAQSPGRRAAAALAALAATLVLANGVVLFEIRVAYADLAQAFFLALGALLLERARAGAEPPRRTLLYAGLCCGAMASLKPNGFFGAVPLAAMALWLAARAPSREGEAAGTQWPRSPVVLLLLAAPAALLALPWVIKSWLLTGNPVYPFLHDLFGGPDWNAQLGDRFARWQRSIGMGREPLDYLLLPLRVILRGDFGYARFDGELHPGWIVFLPVAIAAAHTDGRCRRLLAMSGMFFALWAASAQQMRFLIPILPLLAAAAARGSWLCVAAASRRSRALAGVLAAGATIAAAGLLVQSAAVYTNQAPRLLHDYARYGARLHEMVRHPVYRFVDEELPGDAKLLLLGTNRGFFVPRAYLADSFFEASQVVAAFSDVASEAAARRRLHELGVTHVLWDRGGNRIAYPAALTELVASSSTGDTLYASEDGRYVVFAVGAAAAGR